MNAQLIFTIIDAKNLKSTRNIYCEVAVINSKEDIIGSPLCTKVVNGSAAPTWNQELTFAYSDACAGAVFRVYEKNTIFFDKFLGIVKLKLNMDNLKKTPIKETFQILAAKTNTVTPGLLTASVVYKSNKPEEKKPETKPEEKKLDTKKPDETPETKPEEKKLDTKKPDEKKTEKKPEEKKLEDDKTKPAEDKDAKKRPEKPEDKKPKKKVPPPVETPVATPVAEIDEDEAVVKTDVHPLSKSKKWNDKDQELKDKTFVVIQGGLHLNPPTQRMIGSSFASVSSFRC